ncbi:hypothetical protein KOW79_014472 [Hemibagrus wyckioides]|uniref:Uncharacterized protein n=1 Tax=Hemibagrus wyckioides TaxID=337641 RepID=A0A9D3NH95_9TELE|nr:hypothetical protein KOW79_014472 [Hemibagrus wyckioides]
MKYSAGRKTGCLFSVNVLMWQPGGSWTIKGTEGQRGQKAHVTLGNSRTKGRLTAVQTRPSVQRRTPGHRDHDPPI